MVSVSNQSYISLVIQDLNGKSRDQIFKETVFSSIKRLFEDYAVVTKFQIDKRDDNEDFVLIFRRIV